MKIDSKTMAHALDSVADVRDNLAEILAAFAIMAAPLPAGEDTRKDQLIQVDRLAQQAAEVMTCFTQLTTATRYVWALEKAQAAGGDMSDVVKELANVVVSNAAFAPMLERNFGAWASLYSRHVVIASADAVKQIERGIRFMDEAAKLCERHGIDFQAVQDEEPAATAAYTAAVSRDAEAAALKRGDVPMDADALASALGLPPGSVADLGGSGAIEGFQPRPNVQPEDDALRA